MLCCQTPFLLTRRRDEKGTWWIPHETWRGFVMVGLVAVASAARRHAVLDTHGTVVVWVVVVVLHLLSSYSSASASISIPRCHYERFASPHSPVLSWNVEQNDQLQKKESQLFVYKKIDISSRPVMSSVFITILFLCQRNLSCTTTGRRRVVETWNANAARPACFPLLRSSSVSLICWYNTASKLFFLSQILCSKSSSSTTPSFLKKYIGFVSSIFLLVGAGLLLLLQKLPTLWWKPLLSSSFLFEIMKSRGSFRKPPEWVLPSSQSMLLSSCPDMNINRAPSHQEQTRLKSGYHLPKIQGDQIK